MKTKVLLLVQTIFCLSLFAADYKPIITDPSYEHDKWSTLPVDIRRDFRAFTVSFDSDDDNDGSGSKDTLGVPEWVAYEIKSFGQPCIPTSDRPSPWLTDKDLEAQKIAPTDESYKFSSKHRKHNPDYDRGHLCMKLIAERLGKDAAYNTHTTLNAVPQWATFNQGIWLDLELLTAAWAQRFGRVWVITGPMFAEKIPTAHIGEKEKGELPVAVPDALFKIVVKEGSNGVPDVLAFVYPQVGPGYLGKKFDHKKFLTSVDEIEEYTGLRFLTSLPPKTQKEIKKGIASDLWPAEPKDFIAACRTSSR